MINRILIKQEFLYTSALAALQLSLEIGILSSLPPSPETKAWKLLSKFPAQYLIDSQDAGPLGARARAAAAVLIDAEEQLELDAIARNPGAVKNVVENLIRIINGNEKSDPEYDPVKDHRIARCRRILGLAQ